MKIEYHDVTLDRLQQQQSGSALVDVWVKTIDGVPIADCDSETRLAAGFEVFGFLTRMNLVETSQNSTNETGESSENLKVLPTIDSQV